MAWDLSCLDWEARIRAGRSLVPDLPFYTAAADRAVAVYNRLRLPDVIGTPLLEEAGGDWFREIVAAIFGSYNLDGKVRHIRELLLLVPKKNSKTTNAAALTLTALLLAERPRGEALHVGPTQKIADTGFSQIIGMVRLDNSLHRRLHIQEHKSRVSRRDNGASVVIKTFSTDVLTGVKPVFVVIDELHELGTKAHAADVIRQIRGGIQSNPEAFICFVTTQSQRPPSGVFRAELMRARAIRDGRARGAMLPVLYEFPAEIMKSEAWRDPVHWPMVNPNVNRSIHIRRLVDDYETASLAGEEELRGWASQHLNLEIGLALRADRWVGADYWERRAEPGLTLETIIKRSDIVVIGIDGGGLDDMLGLAILGRDKLTRKWLLWTHAWIHSSVLGLRKSEAPKFRDLEAAGDLTIVELFEDAFGQVADFAEQVNDAGLLAKIGLDPVGVGMIVDEMVQRGIGGADDPDRVVGVSQGYKLTGTIKTAEVKLSDGNLIHGGQALMNWCVGNAKLELKGNAVVITKQASGTAKIDPLMAAFNAIALMSLNPEPKHTRSAYEDRPLLVL